MKIEITNSLNEAKWREFINDNPAANIFHSPEFFQIFQTLGSSGANNQQTRLWVAIDAKGQVLALLSLVDVTLMSGLLAYLTTRSVAYGSVLCAPGIEGQEALDRLLRTYIRQANCNVLFTEFRNLVDVSALQPVLQTRGFVYEEHLNYLIDIDRPLEEVMQDIGRRTRKQIRSGLRKGKVIIEEITQKEELTGWYQLLERTYAAARTPLMPRRFFETAFDILGPHTMIKFLIARVDGQIAACSVELLFKDIIYGWYGGVDRSFGSYTPNELLMWHILQWGVENGYRVYDFGGAGHPDEEYGVRDFKAKFGGALVNFGRNTYVHHPTLLKFSKFGYKIYRRFL